MALTFKVSEKGAVSVYGLGRFPVTLYGEQWDRLLAEVPALQAFIAENRSRLATKAAKTDALLGPRAGLAGSADAAKEILEKLA